MTKVIIRAILLGALVGAGCATPNVNEPSQTAILHPDEEDNLGGTFLESGDIRTIAQQMSSAILSTPEVAGSGEVTRIALAPVRNNTRFLIDQNIFLTRLRIELNRVSQGRVRFFMQGNAQGVRSQILQEQDETGWESVADEIAAYLVAKLPARESAGPARLAIGEIGNTNITGMNAQSFLAMVRASVAKQADGRAVFVTSQASRRVRQAMADGEPISGLGVDYVLCGEFLAEGIQVAEGEQEVELTVKQKREFLGPTYSKENTEEETLTFQRRQNPNVTKRFNCQLVDTANETVIGEKMVSLEKKVRSGIGRADYILTGDISALSKASQGAARSDYVIVSYQMVDPSTNEVLWEDAYESKRASRVGTVYR